MPEQSQQVLMHRNLQASSMSADPFRNWEACTTT
jgi:hypothetical protein